MIEQIKAALGWLAGSMLGLAIICALTVLPVFVVLWAGSALGIPWAIAVQFRLAVWLEAALAGADRVLPAWAWFALLTLLWLSFLDVHVRWLVRDELSKRLKALDDKEVS